MNARIQNKWEHCVARFVGQASHGVHMREPNTRIETICKSQSCMVLSETEQAKVGQASHGVHMRDRLMLVRARSVHSYSSVALLQRSHSWEIGWRSLLVS